LALWDPLGDQQRMKRVSIAMGLSLALVACGARFGEGDAGAGGGGVGVDGGASDSGVKVTGAGCGEVLPGVTLCRAVRSCPTLVVDSDQFPNCGFRIRGSALDLECACDRSLCPMGVPVTCADAERLLSSQHETMVCLQLDEGRCSPR
jgi:hypothetical protein